MAPGGGGAGAGSGLGAPVGSPPACACGSAAVRRQTQKPGPNVGRWFWCCARPPGSDRCRFFSWDSPAPAASAHPFAKRDITVPRVSVAREERPWAPPSAAAGGDDAFEEALLAMELPGSAAAVAPGSRAGELDRFAYGAGANAQAQAERVAGARERDATWWEEASKRQKVERAEEAASRAAVAAAASAKPVRVALAVCGANEIGARFALHGGASEACRRVGGRWERDEHMWVVPLDKHDALVQALAALPGATVDVDPVPQGTLRAMEAAMERGGIGRASGTGSSAGTGADAAREGERAYRIPRWQELYPFQQEGVRFGVSREGRCMIADEMGLGKTVQGIALALQYRVEDWPCLVICPSSLRFNWKAMFEAWAGDVEVDVTVLMSTKASEVPALAAAGAAARRRAVVVATYDMLSRGEQVLRALLAAGFNCVVLDESHCIKNASSNRTRGALQLLAQSRRRVLLSGTPALSRPIELFTQLKAVAPEVFRSEVEFGERYCGGGTRNAWSGALQYSGASNLKELSVLLERTVMVRRKKKDVLKELPDKTRTRVTLPPPAQGALRSLAKVRADMDKASAAASACAARGDTAGAARYDAERQGYFGALYTQSALAKADGVVDYVKTLLEADPDSKLIVFAHHKPLMDTLERAGKDAKAAPVRIDGNTGPQDRHALVARFQDEPSVRLAVLSITAAGVGLTLTAASVVVFAELYYNPSSLIQAEDRAHRIGQRNVVSVRYLISPGTIDEMMWRMVERKLRNIGMAVDGALGELGARSGRVAAKPAKADSDEWWVEGTEALAPTGAERHSGFLVGAAKDAPSSP